jgi:signal transduction histidine kinase
MSPRALLDRLRAVPPLRLDLLLGLLVLAETQVEALLVGGTSRQQATAHLIGVGVAACVALHRRATWPAFLAANAIFVIGQGSGQAVTDHLVLPLFVILLVNVSAAAQIHGRAFWLVPLVTATAGVTGTAIDAYEDDASSYLLEVLVLCAGTAAAGRLLDSRLRLGRALREKAARLEAERAEEAGRAVVAERERIAGDLHDIIAHALTGMVVQASAARRLTDRDPERARAAFAAVEDSGREALGELRRLLGVLRREDEELALAPTPSLAHVEALVRRASAAGLPSRLAVEGEAVPLPAGVDVTAYRVVQEALTAALRTAAAGRAEVRVRYAPGGVELEVTDDGHGGPPEGRALIGIRERVRLVGGELHVGSRRAGGHRVHARLPVERAA